MRAIDPIIRGHHSPWFALFEGDLERLEIDLAKRTLADLAWLSCRSIIIMEIIIGLSEYKARIRTTDTKPLKFLVVRHIMFDCCAYSLAL